LVVYTFRRADRGMARHRPEKKREPRAAADIKILPTQLRVGDRLSDETGEYEVIGRPYTTAGGKNAHARVKRVDSEVAMIRSWSAHERIAARS
jgi:hypothetical protein